GNLTYTSDAESSMSLEGQKGRKPQVTTMAEMQFKQDTAGGGAPARRRRYVIDRRGVVAVEAAVCLPVIIILMLAMWEIGRMEQMSRIVKDAAREGARVAAG